MGGCLGPGSIEGGIEFNPDISDTTLALVNFVLVKLCNG